MSENKINLKRRDFLARGAAAIALFPILASAPRDAFGQDSATKAVDPSTPLAQALGYVHDATKADIAKFPKRSGADGQKQFCHNCALFQNGGTKLAGHEGQWGKCGLFADGLVNANGWCNSWVLKPA